MSLPDFDTLVLDRLFVCNREIAAASQDEMVYRLPPVNAQLELPLFHASIGAMAGPIQSAYFEEVVMTRVYLVVAVIMPLGIALDDEDAGADILTLAATYPHKFRNYYLARPFLTTETQEHDEPLEYIQSMTFQDTGFVPRRSLGGGEYLVLEFSLTIGMKSEVDVII